MYEYSRWISVLLASISMFMIFCAKDIVSFIFEHGAFQSSSSEIVWQCMICYAVGVVPAGLQTYFIRVFYALKDMMITVYIQVFALICNIAMNILTVNYLKHIGIALSTSISYLIALILLALLLQKRHGIKSIKKMNYFAMVDCFGAMACGWMVFVFVSNIGIKMTVIRLAIETITFFSLYVTFIFFTQRELALKCYDVLVRKIKSNNSEG